VDTRGGHGVKRILVFSLSLILCISFAGCAKEEHSSSAGSSSLDSPDRSSGLEGLESLDSLASVSSREISEPGASPSSGVSSSNPAVSKTDIQTTSEYQALINQLDDLKKVLGELDQISDTDVEIPAS